MLQAWIASPEGSLYFAAEATPCNLQELSDHLRGMRRFKGEELRLSLSVSDEDDGTVLEGVSHLLDGLAADGVQVSFSSAPESEHRVPTAPLGRGARGRGHSQRRTAREGRSGRP